MAGLLLAGCHSRVRHSPTVVQDDRTKNMKIILLGATGQVGQALLQQALAEPAITQITAPTRQPLPLHDKLCNPVIDFSQLPTEAEWWQADALLSALGTTRRQAGSLAAFRAVDLAINLACAHAARQHGTLRYGLVSALGANAKSWVPYPQIKGELELAVHQLDFEQLVLIRPALLDAPNRPEPRPMEALGLWLSRRMSRLLPARYRPVTPSAVAATLLAAIQHDIPGVQIIESEQIQTSNKPDNNHPQARLQRPV